MTLKTEMRSMKDEIRQMRVDIELIKQSVVEDEGELTDWAKKELAKSRAKDAKWYSLEEVRAEILGR